MAQTLSRNLSIVGASAVIAILLAGCGSGQKTASTPAAPEPTPEQKAAMVAALPAPYNTADIKNGEEQFALCQSCHTVAQGGPNMTGPNLYGVFGRKTAALTNFAYSDALKAANFTWDAEHLNQWLAEPRTFMPGTKMTFAGLKDEKDRRDLIAFLKTETGYVKP